VATLDRAIAAEERIVATYQTALAGPAGPAGMRALLETVLGEHQAHLAQLRSQLVVPRGSRSAVARPSSSPPVPALPGQPAGLLAALAAAERGAAARLLHQLVTAPPSLAQLLASIGAAEAAHVVLLTRPRLP
jgi:hypothetical protein